MYPKLPKKRLKASKILVIYKTVLGNQVTEKKICEEIKLKHFPKLTKSTFIRKHYQVQTQENDTEVHHNQFIL